MELGKINLTREDDDSDFIQEDGGEFACGDCIFGTWKTIPDEVREISLVGHDRPATDRMKVESLSDSESGDCCATCDGVQKSLFEICYDWLKSLRDGKTVYIECHYTLVYCENCEEEITDENGIESCYDCDKDGCQTCIEHRCSECVEKEEEALAAV